MLVGVICGYDGKYREFSECICSHENGTRTCHVPVQVLKMARDNHIDRKGSGWSASTLLACAREWAISQQYDYYETPESAWNKARGSWVHSMIESDTDPKPGLIRERRIQRTFVVDGVEVTLTGKPDEIDPELGLLIDYKSKDSLPSASDISHPRHEAQFNFYAGLCNGGVFMDTGEPVNIKIRGGGMHFLTWKTKNPFIKIGYRLWSEDELQTFIEERVRPLLQWKATGELPECNAFTKIPSKNWKCYCEKLTDQLQERGIQVEERRAV